MTSDSTSRDDSCRLQITLGSQDLALSQVSRMLRVLQTAVREVAREVEDAQPFFEQQRQPVLLLSADVEDERLTLSVFFAEAKGSAPMPELSSMAFRPFIEQFESFLRTGPQLGLWGPVVRRATTPGDEAVIARRLRDVRLELRHFAGATISFGDRSITFDGDQVTLG